MGKYPQVLFLGNGINRAYGGNSWNQLLRQITTNPRIKKAQKLTLPMPLQTILVTEDNIDSALRKVAHSINAEDMQSGLIQAMQTLLSMGFDHILTTNYTYELEKASQADTPMDEKSIEKMVRHTEAAKRAETKYRCYTYNQVDYKGHCNRVWHIHGEQRKPNGMIIGLYYYVNYLQKIIDFLNSKKDKYLQDDIAGEQHVIQSWMDAYILGDIYVLGFEFDTSEIDLWWMLNRKKREKVDHGKLFFYEPRKGYDFDEKIELLRVLGAEILDLGYTILPDEEEATKSRRYRSFYQSALENIQSKLNR